MKYIIMLAIIMMLALADIATGFIKGSITDRPRSKKMRIGGLHKLAEIIVMCTSIGLEIGIVELGKYYDVSTFAGIVGAFMAFSVFSFISVMEIVSILENYAEINPDAAWVKKVIKKIKKKSADIEKENYEENDKNT